MLPEGVSSLYAFLKKRYTRGSIGLSPMFWMSGCVLALKYVGSREESSSSIIWSVRSSSTGCRARLSFGMSSCDCANGCRSGWSLMLK